MRCSICSHDLRKKIDASIVRNADIRGTARKFKISEDALSRHVNNGHVSKKIEKKQKTQDIKETDSFLAHIQKRRDRFTQMANQARVNKDPILELKVYATESKFTEMEGRCVGAFNDKLKVSGGDKPIKIEWITVSSAAKIFKEQNPSK